MGDEFVNCLFYLVSRYMEQQGEYFLYESSFYWRIWKINLIQIHFESSIFPITYNRFVRNFVQWHFFSPFYLWCMHNTPELDTVIYGKFTRNKSIFCLISLVALVVNYLKFTSSRYSQHFSTSWWNLEWYANAVCIFDVSDVFFALLLIFFICS